MTADVLPPQRPFATGISLAGPEPPAIARPVIE